MQPKPVPDVPVPEGALVPLAWAGFTSMGNPLTAAQLSMMGRRLVRMKLPPDCEKISKMHQNFEFGGHTHRAGEDPESAEAPLM